MAEANASSGGRARAGTLAVMAVLAGVWAGLRVGDWIVAEMAGEMLRTVVGGMSFLALAAAYAKDGLLALIDVARSLWSGAGVQEGRLGSAIATLFVVGLLGATFAKAYLAFSEGNVSPSEGNVSPTLCEQIADSDDGVPAAAEVPLISKCLRAEVAQLATKVDGLAGAMEEFDRAVGRIDAKVSPCPFLFENAKLVEGETRLDGRGVCLEEGHFARLRDVAGHLADHCHAGLRLNVVGYASEAPFRNVPQSDSDELNRQAANQRAASVAAALQHELRHRNVDAVVDVKVWREGESMRRPGFADSDAIEQRDRWLIGRSVFIHVAESSSCHVLGRGPDGTPTFNHASSIPKTNPTEKSG